MAIVEVHKNDNRQLQNIANTLATAKKIVVVTGAGISTNCGIPDFRSEEGLYSLIQSQRDAADRKRILARQADRQPLSPRRHANVIPTKSPIKQPSIPTNIRGKDLFDAQLWNDPTSTSVFYTFIASLRKTIQEDVKRTTATHRFIKTLRDRRKLVRCYTQNFDGLESREGLCTDMGRGKGNRARFTKQSIEKPRNPARLTPGGDLDSGCEVIQLHGDLDVLRCTLCQQTCPWDEHNHDGRLLSGKAPICHSCIATNTDRQDRGKRGTKIGTLRPNIVLYGEEHPSADVIGNVTTHDLALSPDLLLVLGTSLHVHGLKILVKEFARSVHARAGGRGKVIFVNLSRPAESTWKDVFDYWVGMDCDEWVGAMRRHRPDLFQVQDELRLRAAKPITKPRTTFKPILPIDAAEEDKENVNVRTKLFSTPRKRKANLIENSILLSHAVEEDKENIKTTINPATTPRKLPITQPRVLITPKKSSSNFLTKLQNAATKHPPKSSIHTSEAQSQLDTQLQLQLPTPPNTAHRARFHTPSSTTRKRGLAETYQEMCDSPSKRRKKGVRVWEDEGREGREMLL